MVGGVVVKNELTEKEWIIRESKKYWVHYWFYLTLVLFYSLIYFPFIDKTITFGDFMNTYIYAMSGMASICAIKVFTDWDITGAIYNKDGNVRFIIYLAAFVYLLQGMGRVVVVVMSHIKYTSSLDLSLLSMFGFIFIIFGTYSIDMIQDPKEYYK